MFIGAHFIIYSTDPDADRAFLKDILELEFVDAGRGWLIFGLPPAEIAVHPTDGPDFGQNGTWPMAPITMYFMCENIDDAILELTARGAACDPVSSQGWGKASAFSLPSGAKIGVYEPHHPTAI